MQNMCVMKGGVLFLQHLQNTGHRMSLSTIFLKHVGVYNYVLLNSGTHNFNFHSDINHVKYFINIVEKNNNYVSLSEYSY